MSTEETYRGPGWWLPDPSNRFDARNGPERTQRFKLIGAWVIRLWLIICVGFGGLLWSAGSLNFGQVFFGTLVFVGGSGLMLVMILALAWYAT